jgi:autotransporter-associated beta strand protein
MNLTGNDLVIRHVRWRYGKQTAGGDSVDIANSQRVILDHCDLMFSTDENISSFGTPPEFFTFQWSVNAWGLSGHSCGGLWDINHATAHHTLWANNHTRNPKCISPTVLDWVNNVTFGWDLGFNMAASTDPIARVNIRGSYFIHGGNTSSAVYGGGLNTLGENIFRLHMSDSALDGSANGILDVTRANYAMVNSSTYTQAPVAWPQTLDGNPANPVIGTPVTLDSRRTAHKKVLSKVGATRMEIGPRPLRDEITQLCVDRAAVMQRGIISDPLELNLSTGTAFADLKSSPAPADTDLDGMPDEWEDALGLDKEVPNNNEVLSAPQTAASFFPAGSPAGYTQLEEYLHFKAVPHGTVAKNTVASPSFIDIDLGKFTSGFTASPAFTISNVTNGTISQSGSGGSVLRFTPTPDFSGRGGFLFTVTDSEGDTWTQQCCLLVSNKTQPRPILWAGDGVTNDWDTTSANFTSNTGPVPFADGDAVTIDDSGSNEPGIRIVGALAPASLAVSNPTTDFTVTGTGGLVSTGGFLKSGSGSLAISNSGPNSFTTATMEGGTLSLATTNALGSAPIYLTAGTLLLSRDQSNALVIAGDIAINPSGNRIMTGTWSGNGSIQITNTGSNLLTLGGGMSGFSGNVDFAGSTGNVRLNGNTGSANTAFDLGSSTVTLHTRNGGVTVNLGSLSGGNSTRLSGASSVPGTTTFSVGAMDSSTTFAGSITDGSLGASASTALTKTGTGTLALTGNSTHSGATTINEGALELLGSFGTSPVTVGAGAVLAGTGNMGGSLSTLAGGILSPGADNGSGTGTFTAASLILDSPVLRFDLSNNPATNNDRIEVSGGGAVFLNGPQDFRFNLSNGSLGPGTYDLITTTGTLTATNVTLVSNLPAGTRQSITLEHSPTGTAPGYVRLVVSGTNADLTWTGANGALWDQQTTAAWSGASPATFYNFDNVSFTDTAGTGGVTITQPVAPRSIIVDNTSARPYTITGAAITGTTSLVKSGGGALTLSLPRYDLQGCSITTGSPIATVPD